MPRFTQAAATAAVQCRGGFTLGVGSDEALDEQASTLVTSDMVASAVPRGDDLERFAKAISGFATAGFDKIYLRQIGPNQEQFFEFWSQKLAAEVGAAQRDSGRRD